LAFIIITDVTAVILGVVLLVWGGLGWAGRRPALGRWPAGSAPSRAAGRAWAGVGAGALITVGSDLIGQPNAAAWVSWTGMVVMLAAFLIAVRSCRRHGFQPRPR
jgi:hypothetical protein